MNLLVFNLRTDADDSVLGFTTDWINALAARCNRVVVVTMMAGRIAVADNVKVYSVGKEKGYSEPRRLLEFYRLLGKVLREEKINACFAHMMPLFAVLGWPLLKKRGIPIVLWYTHSHVPPLLRLATFLVDRVVSASPSGFRIATNKVSFIGHGIDVERFLPVSQRKPDTQKLTFLTVGRISPVKRLEVPLKALCLLPEGIRQRIKLRYIGDPLDDDGYRYAAELRQIVETLGLDHSVQFEPALPFHCVQNAYQSVDIFINTSDTDSIDKTVLEAMSCGVPIITSNVAFVDVLGPELSRDWLIPKNDARVLALRLQSLVEMSRDERRVLGLQLRDIVVSDHSLPTLAGRLLKVIDSCRGAI